jgi:hypothetical protein
MKKKKKEEEKFVNRNSRDINHCTCSIEHVIELENDNKQISEIDLFE